jgi:Ser/Thr protein kinase RdoA (MazF antagonist)
VTDVEALQAHLADTYGFHAKFAFSFEDDVVLLRDAADRRWIARVFPTRRPRATVEGDAGVLAWLEDRGYPAERRISADCVSMLEDGRTVLVTQGVPAVARARRRQTIKDAGGIRGLGELLARLGTLEPDAEAVGAVRAVRRPGGAWHHMADGLPAAELAVAADWLTEARERAGVRELAYLDSLGDALAAIDACDGLPEALIHPDFVLANVVATEAPGGPAMVLVDWAGAGRGPRLWALAFLLWAEGAKDLRRVDLAMAGYRRHVRLEPEELDRLAGAVGARPLVFEIWHLHHGGRAAADAAAAVAQSGRLASAIAERARAAFRA